MHSDSENSAHRCMECGGTDELQELLQYQIDGDQGTVTSHWMCLSCLIAGELRDAEETAAFWEEDPDAIDTEVFFFPAASYAEKEGTFTNTQRLLQWREKAVDPPGDARSELHFVVDLGRIVPGRTDVKVYSRVIMTPLHAKQLLEALAQNISLFEQKFGEIRTEAATQYSVNEPSN